MVKILDFTCVYWETFDYRAMQTTQTIYLDKKYTNVLMFFVDLECFQLCVSSTIFLPMVTLWQPLKNKNFLRA